MTNSLWRTGRLCHPRTKVFDPDSPYEDEASATFKRHEIHVTREPECDWYIRVTAPCGRYAYDGYWRDSWYRSSAEAIEEAKRGACLAGGGKGHD